jgi:uncharacterized protein
MEHALHYPVQLFHGASLTKIRSSSMPSSIFNLRVPLANDEVFLMNTLTDAQAIVSSDVAALLDAPLDVQLPDAEIRAAFETLVDNGFISEGRDADRAALNHYLTQVTSDTSELNVTVLTTLQCNFACDYCFQGDHGDYNKFAEKMSLEMAARVASWIERELDRVRPEKFVLTFFGGEPLLNLPVMYYLAERLWAANRSRHIQQITSIITNGLLLTEDVVERMNRYGLKGVKITLDGDRDTHNRMRPLRGGQGTFDRIIENMRRIAGKCQIAIGGNFDDSSFQSYTALLGFLKEEFEGKLVKVNFKPTVRSAEDAGVHTPKATLSGTGLSLTPVKADGSLMNPLGGTCMTSAGAGTASTCDSCRSLDDQMTFLRDETRRHGFNTADGVHNGPCHVHMKHAHTIGPDGSLYACPGFTGEKQMSTGHIDDRRDPLRDRAQGQFDRLSPWSECGDCAFIPVCAGGCIAASHMTLGDMNTPACHKRSYESAVISLAHQFAGAS